MFPLLAAAPAVEKPIEAEALNWLQFVDHTIEHLAWPAIVLIIICLAHPHIKALVDRILEFSFGGATVKFGQFLTKGTEIVDEAPKEGVTRTEPRPFVPGNKYRQIAAGPDDLGITVLPETRNGQATHSIFASFAGVEEQLENIGEAMKVKVRNGALMRTLMNKEYVSGDCIELYDNLRLARNSVAHGQAAMPTVAESLEYQRQADYLDGILNKVLLKVGADKKKSPEEAAP
jgi:hypothetical protein